MCAALAIPCKRPLGGLATMLLAFGLMTALGCEGPPEQVESVGAALATTFPVVCRGGVNPVTPLQLSQRFGTDGATLNEFSFSRSPVSGNNRSAMPAGSCAWQDRPIAASEPDRLCLDGVRFIWHARSRFVAPSQENADLIAASSPVPGNAAMQNVLDLLFSDATMFRTFMLRNDFADCLRTQ
jgi:hypothetical protein